MESNFTKRSLRKLFNFTILDKRYSGPDTGVCLVSKTSGLSGEMPLPLPGGGHENVE